MSVRSPWYVVEVLPDGGSATGPLDLSDRVLSFELEDNERKADRLRITVDNFDLANFDDPVWRHGTILRVSFGNGEQVSPVREMIVLKVTGGRVLTIEAKDRAVAMDTVKRRTVFENLTRSEVAQQVAIANGFQSTDIEPTPERFEIINQGNLTDAQFLRKLAHLEGYQFFVDFDGLHWHRRRTGQAPIRTLTYYANDPEAFGDILDFSVENDITRKPGRVRVRSRDPIQQTEVEAVADNATDTGRDTLQEFIGVIDPESAELTLQVRVGVEETVPSNVQTQEDATREATAKYRLAAQRAVQMTLKIRGAPSLLAKSVVNITGLGARLSGRYYIKSITHPLSGSQGYVSNLKVVSDGYGRGYSATAGGGSSSSSGAADIAQTIASCREDVQSAIAANNSDDSNVNIALQSLARDLAAAAGVTGNAQLAAINQAANQATRAAAVALASGAGDVQAVAASCSYRLRNLSADATDARASGNLNTKQEAASNTRTQIAEIDPETGQTRVRYIDNGGRDA